MLPFLARRTLAAIVLVAVVSSGALLLTRLAPGDFASDLFGSHLSAEAIARERARYGLDQPIARQYLDWMGRAARLDFGTSLLYRRPVAELVWQRAGNTALLAAIALAFATVLGLPAGILTGSRRGPGRQAFAGLKARTTGLEGRTTPGGATDAAAALVRGLSLVFLSLPSLVMSLLLVLLAARTGWFPTGGMTSAGAWDAGVLAGLADLARHLPIPALALALPIAASIERLASQSLADALAQPYSMAAIARGVPRARLVWRDALRPALGPIGSVYGFILGSLLSGSFIVEVVTSWPGLGRLMYDALRSRDLFLVAGCAAAGALFLAAGSLVSDLLLAWADPRVRERERSGEVVS